MPETWYLVVGGSIFDVTDDYLQRLQRVATDLGLAARTVFTGHLEDIRPALAAMDVFVHAGDPEPFGLVNIEAMAMAKPVVAFSHGALPEIVVDGDTGLLVPPGDEAALAEAAVALLRNPAWRALLGEKGRERVAQLFTAERMTANVSSVFAQVVR
jgi:glycosyltransferase involved in cell wall biosynthesis